MGSQVINSDLLLTILLEKEALILSLRERCKELENRVRELEEPKEKAPVLKGVDK